MQKFFSKFKRFILVATLLGVWVAACSSTKYDRKASLIVATPNAPILLDPRLASDAEGQKIASLLYDGLVDINEKQEIVPLLAEKWEEREPLTYQFHLRPKVRFSNGAWLTSKDVVCTYQYILNPANVSPLRSEFEKIEYMIPEDDHTLTIRLKEPHAPFFILLRKGIVSCDGKSGTGPYTLVSMKPDRQIVLEANPSYFLGAPKLRYLIFDVVKDDTTRVLKLLSKEVDLIQNAVAPLLIEKLSKNKNLKILEANGTTFAYVGINLKDPILKNMVVRKALALALDRDEIIKHLWKGLAQKANSLLTPSHWAYSDPVKIYHHNLNLAKQMLDTAGFSAKGGAPRFQLILKTSTIKDRIEIARILAHQWSEAGVEVRVEPYEWGTFFQDIKSGNFQLFTSTWVGVVEPDLFYNILNSKQLPPNGANRGFYINPEIDFLTEQGRVLLDPAQRRPIYRRIQEIITEELPFIPLWYEKNVVVYYDDLKGVSLSPEPNYRNFMKVTR